MIDGFGRRISYVRMSVTDRCDLRCRYCMAETMAFLPRKDVLSLEEIVELADLFIARGVRRIRLTGGEPLVRRGIESSVDALGARRQRPRRADHDHQRHAARAARADAVRWRHPPHQRQPRQPRSRALPAHHPARRSRRRSSAGIEAAASAGLKIKINMVALKGLNEDEIARDAALVREARDMI